MSYARLDRSHAPGVLGQRWPATAHAMRAMNHERSPPVLRLRSWAVAAFSTFLSTASALRSESNGTPSHSHTPRLGSAPRRSSVACDLSRRASALPLPALLSVTARPSACHSSNHTRASHRYERARSRLLNHTRTCGASRPFLRRRPFLLARLSSGSSIVWNIGAYETSSDIATEPRFHSPAL